MRPEAPKLLEDVRHAGAYIIEKTHGKSLNEYLATAAPQGERSLSRCGANSVVIEKDSITILREVVG